MNRDRWLEVACVSCDQGLRSEIFGSGFAQMLGMVGSPLLLAGVLVSLLHLLK
jgi:hypothetical protein